MPNPHWYRAGQIRLAELRVPFISSFETNYREYLAGQVPMTVVPTAYMPADHTLPDFHAAPTLAIDLCHAEPGHGQPVQTSVMRAIQ